MYVYLHKVYFFCPKFHNIIFRPKFYSDFEIFPLLAIHFFWLIFGPTCRVDIHYRDSDTD